MNLIKKTLVDQRNTACEQAKKKKKEILFYDKINTETTPLTQRLAPETPDRFKFMVDIFRCVKRKDYLRYTFDPNHETDLNHSDCIFDQRKVFEFDANVNQMNFGDLRELLVRKFGLKLTSQKIEKTHHNLQIIYFYSSDKDTYTLVADQDQADKETHIWDSEKLAFGDGYQVEFAAELIGDENCSKENNCGGEDEDVVEMPAGF